MRVQFVESKSREEVKRLCPWAAVIVKTDGGYVAFESVDDDLTWRNQV